MERRNVSRYILTFMALSLFKLATATANEGIRKYVLCKNGKEVRTLRVEKGESNNWVTYYTKAGKDEVVGQGLNPASTEDVLGRVQKTLESNSWKCKDVSKDHQIFRSTAAATQ